jgi:hypothetical protein
MMQELTPSSNQDKIWHEKNLLGILHTSPTLGVCIAKQHNSCGVQASLHNRFLTRNYHGVVVGVALMFLGVTYHSFFLISIRNG